MIPPIFTYPFLLVGGGILVFAYSVYEENFSQAAKKRRKREAEEIRRRKREDKKMKEAYKRHRQEWNDWNR